MNDKELKEKRWQLFLHIIDKQDLDLKGECMQDYHSNFKSAFNKADNIVRWYKGRLNLENENK